MSCLFGFFMKADVLENEKVDRRSFKSDLASFVFGASATSIILSSAVYHTYHADYVPAVLTGIMGAISLTLSASDGRDFIRKYENRIE